MAKKNYRVIRAGSYGAPGDVIELDLGKDGLSDRQKIMLKPYSDPVVKADESKERAVANVAIEELTEKLTALEVANKELAEANVAATKAKGK